jgi:spore maturation protein CgeB
VRFVIFCHSLASDWNHGNAHFLRGIASELLSRGHGVTVYEPVGGWSAANLALTAGAAALSAYREAYPALRSTRYAPADLDLDGMLERADVVLVHEWNEPELVKQIGDHRRRTGGYQLYFHDTHHRSVTAPEAMSRYDLSQYDGVLAFGAVVADAYIRNSWAKQAWVWHEAADTRVFRPRPRTARAGDVVWIGNWGDGERTAELEEFLLRPALEIGLSGAVHGVRYPDEARATVATAGLEYRGWLPNHQVPEAFAAFDFTVHIPRRPYASSLPGIPTIRVFEALACGIPLVCAPWDDTEGLFTPGRDYLVAADGSEMREQLRALASDAELRRGLASEGVRTIRDRHSCAHRVDELLALVSETEHGLVVA